MLWFFLSAICQAVFGRFAIRSETPRVTFRETDANKGIVRAMKRLRSFKPSSRGGAFHTVFGNMRNPSLFLYTKREELGDTEVTLDWANYESRKGIVVVYPGIASSSCSVGIRRLAEEVCRRGYACVVYNRPGHGENSALERAFPRHGDTNESHKVITYLSSRNLPVYAVGLSGGGNSMVKYMGEMDDDKNIRAAVSVCNPLDLVQCYNKFSLKRGLDRTMSSWVMDIYARHKPRFRVRSMKDFDEAVTGVPWPDYYTEKSSVAALKRVKVPILCIGADNDPIVHRSIIDAHDDVAMENPNVISARTRDGGHLGWLTDGGNWMESVAIDFIDEIHQRKG